MLDISPVRLIEQLAHLQISYNLCNLPKQITAANGKTVKYTYFADGAKFKAVDAIGNGFVYTGSLRWSVQNGTLTPESIAITGGRAVYSDNNWATNYYIADHLGSVRTVTDAEGEVLDTFDYMPYGSEISSRSSATTDYRFTGKERQSKVNNSIYDSFARFQNTYGRFMSIDPKAESFYHISPYTYCAGDPVNLVDPDGMIIKDPYKLVRKYRTYLKTVIYALKYEADKNIESYNDVLNENKNALNELKKLKKSNNVYVVEYDSKLKVPETNKDTGVTCKEGTIVYIKVSTRDDLGLLGHELKHAYQYENNPSLLEYEGSYDINDEKEAYRRQAAWSGGLFDFYEHIIMYDEIIREEYSFDK